jgi:hypothetical protein
MAARPQAHIERLMAGRARGIAVNDVRERFHQEIEIELALPGAHTLSPDASRRRRRACLRKTRF